MTIRMLALGAILVLGLVLAALPLPAHAEWATYEMPCQPPELATAVLQQEGLRPVQTFRGPVDRAFVLWIGQDADGRQTWALTIDLTGEDGRTWRCLLGDGPPDAPGEPS